MKPLLVGSAKAERDEPPYNSTPQTHPGCDPASPTDAAQLAAAGSSLLPPPLEEDTKDNSRMSQHSQHAQRIQRAQHAQLTQHILHIQHILSAQHAQRNC